MKVFYVIFLFVFLVVYNEKTTPASPREVRTAANLLHRLTIWRPPQMKSPAAEGRRAHISITRISAIA